MVKCDKTNRRKTLDEFALEAEGNEEEASLSLFDLLCIGIGGTVGSGVFVLTGEVYPVAGPSSALCWMIAGGVCLLSEVMTLLKIALVNIRIDIGPDGIFDSVNDLLRDQEGRIIPLRDNRHWVAIRSLVEGVRAAGGTWAAYARLPRLRVLRLRSLVARGRARTADPIIEPVFRLPNEMCWHVLEFWRATCATTGEVL